jgi:hypothetical protein
MNIDIDQEQCVNKHNKNIQTVKRQMLNVELEQCDMKLYLNHQTSRLIRQIRFKESRLHVKQQRHRRRYSLSTKKTVDVYPRIIVDVEKVSLDCIQLDYLPCYGKLELLFTSHFINSILYLKCMLLYLILYMFIIWSIRQQ